jgi:hypothetical protein
MSRLEILCTLPSVGVGVLQDPGELLHISLFRSKPTMADMISSGDIIDAYRLRHGRPMPELVIFPGLGQLPDDEVRQRFARKSKGREALTLATVTVFAGDGFAAAVARSIATAIHMASQRKRPLRMAASLPEAIRLLHDMGWCRIAAPEIERAVATLSQSPRT